MLVFVITEAMLFAGMISAFSVVRASAPLGWPPLDQPRLPAESTAVNTAFLIASGVLVAIAAVRFERSPATAKLPLGAGIALGAVFVAAQGREWVALIAQGLTLTSSALGSFFYLIIGSHGVHAVIALGVLGWAFVRLARGTLTDEQFWTVRVFWYFVVGIWPFLYQQVYL
jgi:heme/copper-type cytochrome/quinol oxidase subunit 3